MEHTHEHHSHGHTHDTSNVAINTSFVVGILLNLTFVLVEAITGLVIHSLSLLSDAGHNLADVGALALSLLAFRLLKVRSNRQYTYGFRKTSILVALINAIVLLISIGAILYVAIHRLFFPHPVPGFTISFIAGIGILINALAAWMFVREKDKDINIKSTYLHFMSDALFSIGLVIGGIIIQYTHWYWLDSSLSVIIAVFILFSTWKLLVESLRLSLDGVPENIHMENLRKQTLKIKGVIDIHHIHVWAISTTENALTAHLVLQLDTTPEQEQQIKQELRHMLLHQNIHHVTLETEHYSEECGNIVC